MGTRRGRPGVGGMSNVVRIRADLDAIRSAVAEVETIGAGFPDPGAWVRERPTRIFVGTLTREGKDAAERMEAVMGRARSAIRRVHGALTLAQEQAADRDDRAEVAGLRAELRGLEAQLAEAERESELRIYRGLPERRPW